MEFQNYLNIGLSTAGILTAVWAVFTWRKQQTYNSIRWQNELVNKFYFSTDFHEIRLRFEFDFFDHYGPALERWDTNKDLLTEEDKRRIGEVDAAVNFFENLLYIIDSGHISEKDHFAAFSYWYVLMRDREHACLRQYLRYGFEHIESRTKIGCEVFVALDLQDKENIEKLNHYSKGKVATCKILASTGDGASAYCLKKSNVLRKYVLIKVGSGFHFDSLDHSYGFFPGNWEESKTIRRYIAITNPDVGAWAYISYEDRFTFSIRKTGKWEISVA